MKVLLVHNSYQQPGGEDVVFDQERGLLERAGHEVTLYQRSNFEINKSSGFGKLVLAKNVIWSSDAYREFSHLLQVRRPELVHVHNTFAMISPSIYWACQELGIPVVQTLHNFRLECLGATFFRSGKICTECLGRGTWRGVVHACYQDSRANSAAIALMLAAHRRWRTFTEKVDHYIALTEFGRRTMVSGGLPAPKISVKPNFVDPDPGWQSGKIEDGSYALFVGRLSPEKGVQTILAAWKLLKSAIPLRIIGTGPERQALEAEAAWTDGHFIRFEGQLPREKVWAAMRGARFILFPSLWFETFGMTIVEGFACGTPALCSRLGAMEEIVADQRTGLHFETGNAEDLAEKAEWAWAQPGLMRQMGLEARREFEQHYTAEKNYPILMDIYQQAMAAHV